MIKIVRCLLKNIVVCDIRLDLIKKRGESFDSPALYFFKIFCSLMSDPKNGNTIYSPKIRLVIRS